jgi:O-antigen ligase
MRSGFISTNGLPLAVLLMGGVGFIPFLFTHVTIDPVLAPRFAAWALLILLLLLLLAVQSGRGRFNVDFSLARRALVLAAGSYAFFSAISVAQAINRGEGIFELLKILLALVFLFLAAAVLSPRQNSVPILAKAITIAATALSLIGICQYYFLAFNSIPGNYLIYGTMANKNLFASVLLLILAFVLYGVLSFEGYWRVTSLFAFSLIGFCLYLTHTRAVWVALAVATIGGVAFLAIVRRHLIIAPEIKARYRQRLIQIFVLTFVVTLLAASSHSRHASTDVRVAGAFARPLSSIDERLVLWAKTWQMIQDHPVLGVGLGIWKIAIPSYGVAGLRSELGIVHFQRPHNDYLWVLAESGPLALFSYLAIFGIAVFYVFKIIRYANHAGDKLMALLMLWGILGYLTVSSVDFPKERIEHTIFLTFIMAVILSSYHRLFSLPPKPGRFLAPALTVVAFTIALAAAAIGYLRCRMEMHTRMALLAREAGDAKRVIAEIDRAESYFADLDPTATPLNWYKGVAQFSLQHVDEALQSFRAAYSAHPNHLYVLNNLATCHELKGDHAQAIALYQKALAISPRFEETLLNLSAVYFAMQDYQQAYQTLLRCDPASKNPKVHSYLQAVKTKLEETGSL